MKRFFILIAVMIAIFIGAIYIVALPRAEQKIQIALKDMGFKVDQDINLSASLNGLYASKINLAETSEITGLKIDFFWPKFLIKQRFDSIIINEIKITTASRYALPDFKLKNIATHATNQIQIKDVIWVVKTDAPDLTFQGWVNITANEGGKDIEAEILSTQRAIAFETKWSGTLKDNDLILDGRIENFGLRHPPVQINRGYGWLSYIHDAQDKITLAGQIDAGSGEFFDTPIKNINMTMGQTGDNFPFIFRADAAGVDGVTMGIDINYSTEALNQSADIVLDIQDLNALGAYLQATQLSDAPSDYALANKPSKLQINYQADNRFADGPLPFNVDFTQGDDALMNGTFLIYPDTFDIRGTAEADEDFIQDLEKLSPALTDNISGNTLRIDSNLKLLME